MPKSRLKWEYTEDDMADAILDITDHGFSPPQAAQRRGVPRTTLIDRLNGRGAAEDQIQPRRRLSKSQEDRLAFWILRQESLGYAPSHSQIRACVMGLLRQQGEHPDLGRNWVIKFINRRADLKTKMGRRQEAKRFDSFTPRAVHWYFDIRDGQYGWIKPENTVNVDEGGIMTGFGKYSPLLLVGLDSLVVGSADPKRKAFLKGPQTRNWTSFIEAVTADGRALVPGIIFKGKELQKQWFLDEFKQIADWYYITSPNGWTDDHIGIEWLERVYLPQTTPADVSDARLIILDGHGSHATDEWMATCFLNNVYCCYLPAHCSHGLQPLDNGVFNALKAAYRRELERFASLTDSAPMDKKNILSGWRATGNWPISRSKALRHPEIQQGRPNSGPRVTPEPRPYLGSDDTPQTSRQIRDLGLNKTPKTRRRYNVIAKGFAAQQQTVAAHTQRIASLEEELARLKRGKKRKAVPNPNRRFMTLGETLAVGEAIPEGETQNESVVVESVCSDERESESEASSVIEVREEAVPHQRTTRSGRLIKRPKFQ
ncbi:transposase [Fusarium oxysporum f. sp. phaseoli]